MGPPAWADIPMAQVVDAVCVYDAFEQSGKLRQVCDSRGKQRRTLARGVAYGARTLLSYAPNNNFRGPRGPNLVARLVSILYDKVVVSLALRLQ
jgi:hypothetical protein